MDELAAEIAHLLLREGSFRKANQEHQEFYAQLMANRELSTEVSRRLNMVGYDLVQTMGHVGVRVASQQAGALAGRNNMGMHAGHIRLLMYLWTHLVYRELVDLRRDLQSADAGTGQLGMLTADEEPYISYQAVWIDFKESTRKGHFKGYLKALRDWRFVRVDEKRDCIWPDASLYTLIEPHQMEAFVVDLAQRLGTDDPTAAVVDIATGTAIPDEDVIS